jgi:alpha-ribazole phosphatase
VQLYLIRHPKPRDSLGICYGRLDLGVDAEAIASAAIGVRQRISAAVLLRATIYTSPLLRCVAFAQAIANPRAAIVADELVEMDFGAWEGRSWESVPRDELDQWAKDVWGFRPGGGESARAVADRWERWLARLRRSGDDCVIAVTHAGMIRVALAQTAGMDEFVQTTVEYGSVHYLEIPNPSSASPRQARSRA